MSSNKIVLMSSDGESFMVEEVVARQLQIVGHMIDDNCVNNAAIPLQNVTGKILSKVVEYCKKHVDDVVVAEEEESTKDAATKKLDLEAWDKGFMKDFDMETVFKLMIAANYLNVKGLLDLTSQTVADYIKDKTVEEVRGIFNVENDYTPEEEAKVRQENAWAFEGI